MAERFLNGRWKSFLQKKAIPIVTTTIGFLWYRTKLKDLLSFYHDLYNHHPEAMISIGSQGQIVEVNERAIHITRYTKEDLLGKSINTLFPFKKIDFIEEWIKKTDPMQKAEERMLVKTGSYKHVNISLVKSLHTPKKAAIHLIIEDITDKKRQEEHIKFLAYHDELTSLPNRRILMMLIKRLINKEKSFSIMLMDFDGFKQINDQFGHSVGDSFLVQIGNRLVELSEGKAVVGRLGGDEFLVVFPESECTEHAKKIIEGFHEPLVVGKVKTPLTASGGIASYPDQARNSNELLEQADMAMYEMKRNGGNGYYRYSNMVQKQN